jgi:hypothetical protein
MSQIDPALPNEMETRLEEAEMLIWSLLDEQLSEADSRRLTAMLEKDAAVRGRYLECVQLHVDLREHFGRQSAEKSTGTTVLPNLISGLPFEGFPQVTE